MAKYFLLWTVFLFVGIASLGFCFSFQPLSADFSPAGRGSIQTFRIANDSDKPVAVKITMTTREVDIDGRETNRDAGDLFLVFPPQIVVNPGSHQAVRVQWKGPDAVETEMAFRIIAEQLPVDFDRRELSGGSINIMLRYKGAVYIVPENPKPRIVVENVETVKTEGGDKKLEITVENEGNAHVILQDLSVLLTEEAGDKGGTQIILKDEQLQGMNGENILARSRRRFILPWPSELGEGDIRAELNFTPVR